MPSLTTRQTENSKGDERCPCGNSSGCLHAFFPNFRLGRDRNGHPAIKTTPKYRLSWMSSPPGGPNRFSRWLNNMPSEQQYPGYVFPPPASVAEELVEQLSYVIGEVVENERKRLERLSEPGDPVPDDDTLLNNIMYNQKSFESLCQSMSDDVCKKHPLSFTCKAFLSELRDQRYPSFETYTFRPGRTLRSQLEQIVQEVGASAVASRDKETVDRVNNILEGVASEFVNKFSDPSPQPPVRTAFLKTFPHAIRALTSKLMKVIDPSKLDKDYSDQSRGLIVQMTPSIVSSIPLGASITWGDATSRMKDTSDLTRDQYPEATHIHTQVGGSITKTGETVHIFTPTFLRLGPQWELEGFPAALSIPHPHPVHLGTPRQLRDLVRRSPGTPLSTWPSPISVDWSPRAPPTGTELTGCPSGVFMSQHL